MKSVERFQLRTGLVLNQCLTGGFRDVTKCRGMAAVAGVQAIALRNEKGVVLNLSGKQVGLQINADLSGMAISLR